MDCEEIVKKEAREMTLPLSSSEGAYRFPSGWAQTPVGSESLEPRRLKLRGSLPAVLGAAESSKSGEGGGQHSYSGTSGKLRSQVKGPNLQGSSHWS